MSEKPNVGASTWIDPDDAPELTEEFFRTADIDEGETLIRRGRPPSARPKRLVSLRLDQDVLRRLRDLGPGWQTRVNDALRSWVEQAEKP